MRTEIAASRPLRWLPAAPTGRVRHLGAGIAELAVALPACTGDPYEDARILELYLRYCNEVDTR
jgi:hypothetical protein